jgi:hypothetical protein
LYESNHDEDRHENDSEHAETALRASTTPRRTAREVRERVVDFSFIIPD